MLYNFEEFLPSGGEKKLKNESLGTVLVTVLTVPRPLCFCFFLMVFSVTFLPLLQSIVHLKTQIFSLQTHRWTMAYQCPQWSTSLKLSRTLCSPWSLARRMRRDRTHLAQISFCRSLSGLCLWRNHWAQSGTLMWNSEKRPNTQNSEWTVRLRCHTENNSFQAHHWLAGVREFDFNVL